MKNTFIYLIACSGMLFSSCKKFLGIDPPKDQIVSSAVFTDDNSATAATVGIYSSMMQSQRIFSLYTTFNGALYADELTIGDLTNQFVSNSLVASNTDVNTSWTECYSYIYGSNAILEGLQSSTGVTPAVKQQLEGEAKFIRAFAHFYLTNFWGDVPLITTPDYRITATLPRASQAQVYEQIIADLKDAQNLLTANYPTAEKVRPNKWAATALLARVYLYKGDWVNAEQEAAAVIDNGSYSPLPALATAFNKGSKEAIWQLRPVNPSFNTFDGSSFIPSSPTAIPATYLTNDLVNAFEAGDQRKTAWLGSNTVGPQTYYYPYKYKIRSGGTPLNEYLTVLRLAEQYLIRSEARAKQNKIPEAVADLNVIRARAGLADLPDTLSTEQLLQAIEQERRVELFAEWGHRWFDLKRTGRADGVLSVLKPGWQTTDVLWPIPTNQINANPMLTQNEGY